jgi:hypothetical protein
MFDKVCQNSLKFQSVSVWTLFCVIGMLAARDARSTPVQDAQSNMSKAYNDYYQALTNGGKPVSPAQSAELQKQILVPAKQELNQSIVEQTRQTLKKGRWLGAPYRLPDWAPLSSKPQPKVSPDASQKALPTPPSQPEPKPDTVLDGSKIPNEIEFPGPKEKLPSAAAKKSGLK